MRVKPVLMLYVSGVHSAGDSGDNRAAGETRVTVPGGADAQATLLP